MAFLNLMCESMIPDHVKISLRPAMAASHEKIVAWDPEAAAKAIVPKQQDTINENRGLPCLSM